MMKMLAKKKVEVRKLFRAQQQDSAV